MPATRFLLILGLLAAAGSGVAAAAPKSGGSSSGGTSSSSSSSGGSDSSKPAGPHKDLSTDGQLLDRVVALVNDGLVLDSELQAQTHEITERLQGQNVALPSADVMRQQVLDRLVSEEIQSQRADRAGIKVSDEQVNAALETIAKQYKVPFTQLPEKLTEQGYEYVSYRTGLRREIQRQLLQQRDVVQRITISPRELDLYLE